MYILARKCLVNRDQIEINSKPHVVSVGGVFGPWKASKRIVFNAVINGKFIDGTKFDGGLVI